MLGYETLLNFNILQYHKYSLAEFDELIPWEKQLYIKMLTDHTKEQNEKVKQLQMQNKNRRR